MVPARVAGQTWRVYARSAPSTTISVGTGAPVAVLWRLLPQHQTRRGRPQTRGPRWSFLTNHAQVLLYIARDPDARLIDVAAALGITERSAFAIVNDLARAGYVVKRKDGRRNRYEVQSHL